MQPVYWIGLLVGSRRARSLPSDRTSKRFPRSVAVDEVHQSYLSADLRLGSMGPFSSFPPAFRYEPCDTMHDASRRDPAHRDTTLCPNREEAGA